MLLVTREASNGLDPEGSILEDQTRSARLYELSNFLPDVGLIKQSDSRSRDVAHISPRRKLPCAGANALDGIDAHVYVHPCLVSSHEGVAGRQMRVSAPVAAGTVLLVDVPYGIVPTFDEASPVLQRPLICSNPACCLRDHHAAGVGCQKGCIQDVVWCSAQCRDSDQARHHVECAWLKQSGQALRRDRGQYDFAMLWVVVRMLAQRTMDVRGASSKRFPWEARFQRRWESIETCRSNRDQWSAAKIQHWTRLLETYLSDNRVLTSLLEAEDMLRLVCQEESNGFGRYESEVGLQTTPEKSCAMAMYPRGALFNHSCLPNVLHKPDGRSRMVFTAARDLVEGEECCISYFDGVQEVGLRTRQKVLLDMFQFSCTCERCVREQARD